MAEIDTREAPVAERRREPLLDGAPASTVRGPLHDYRAFYSNEAQAGGVELTPWQARVSFADNHDMWRIAAEIDDQRVGMLALALVFSVDAIPAVYYGTEQRFVGTGGDSSRERLWISGFREDTFEYEFIAHLSELRKSLPALRYGDLVVRWASETDGFFAYERTWQGETVLVAINGNASQPAFAEIPTSFRQGSRLIDLLFPGDEEYEVEAQGSLPIQLPPRSAVMLIDR